jgi:hypothetical protein
MRIIQKLLFAVTGIFGASIGVLTMLLANWGFELGLSTTAAFFYGLVGGLLLGWLIAVYVYILVMRYIRKKVMTRFGGIFSIANTFFQNKRF